MLVSALFLLTKTASTMFQKITKLNEHRKKDTHGHGHFGADRGKRKHIGLDVVAKANEPIFAPISGLISRHPFPYENDIKFKGIEIKNKNYHVKIFYLNPTILQGNSVKAGQIIGYAQDLTKKHKGITNHVHLEVRTPLGTLINPETLI